MMPLVPKPNKCQIRAGEFHIPQGDSDSWVQTEINDCVLHPEGYRLTITPQGALVQAATERGIFYGKQTLRQLVFAHKTKMPCYYISDEPAYSHRGFMLDCARHFFPVADIKKMIDAAALFKLNLFHWHLTEDQGWRIEIDQYPELVTIGSVREYTRFGKVLEPGVYSGHYTKDEIREIIAYCKERGIDVVPEFEIPGHASAILAAYPEFSCSGEPVKVKTGGGIFPDILCAGKEAVYTFIERVLDEYIELFPYDKIHLGGDEAPKGNWRACPDCQAKMQAEGLQSENALQVYMMNRVAQYLAGKGKTAVVWNDAIKDTAVDSSVAIQYWMGDKAATVAHVQQGGDVILSDFSSYYLDYSYGQTPLKKTYAYDPAAQVFAIEGAGRILGVEAPLWAEYIPDLTQLAHMGFPRLAAMAETGWTFSQNKHQAGFERRVKQVLPMLAEFGLNWAPQQLWNIKGVKKVADLAKFWNRAASAENARTTYAYGRDKREEKELERKRKRETQ